MATRMVTQDQHPPGEDGPDAVIVGAVGDWGAVLSDHLRARGWSIRAWDRRARLAPPPILVIGLGKDDRLSDAEALARSLPPADDQRTICLINLVDRRSSESTGGADPALWLAGAVTRTLARDMAPTLRVNSVVVDFPWSGDLQNTPVAGPAQPGVLSALDLILAAPAMTGQTLRLAVADAN